MKIGIIGSRTVERVLGSAFIKDGRTVILGTRNTTNPEIIKWKEENPGGITGSFADAASAELFILKTAATAIPDVIKSAGIKYINGKIVIDKTEDMGKADAARSIEPM